MSTEIVTSLLTRTSLYQGILAGPCRTPGCHGQRSAVPPQRVDLPRGRPFQPLLPADFRQRRAGGRVSRAAAPRVHSVRGRGARVVVGHRRYRQAVPGARPRRGARPGVRRGPLAPRLRGGLRLRLLVHARHSHRDVRAGCTPSARSFWTRTRRWLERGRQDLPWTSE